MLSASLLDGMAKKTSVHVVSGVSADALSVATDSGASPMGERLRSVREARGLSLANLAERSGISPEQLSNIENSQFAPSLGLLWKLASGLGAAFADLLGRGGATVSLQRRVDSPVLRSEDGSLESRPLVAAGANRWVEAYELTLAPGSAHASKPHPSGTREIVVVLDGALKLRLGEQEHELQPGDSISFKADLPHAYQNPGSVAGHYHDIIVYEY